MIKIEFKDKEFVEFVHLRTIRYSVLTRINDFLTLHSIVDSDILDYIDCIKNNIDTILIGSTRTLRENVSVINPVVRIGKIDLLRSKYEVVKDKTIAKETIKTYTTEWFKYKFTAGGLVFKEEQEKLISVSKIVDSVISSKTRRSSKVYKNHMPIIRNKLLNEFDTYFKKIINELDNTSSTRLRKIKEELIDIEYELKHVMITQKDDIRKLDKNYHDFFKKYSYQLCDIIDELDLRVCPYCNRQYLDGTKSATLDHFFNKGLYPFYGLSLYNLIPSCYPCNSKCKLDKPVVKDLFDKNLIEACVSPHEFGFGDKGYRFKLKYEGNGKFSPIITETNGKDTAVEQNIKMFKTNEYYQFHSNHVNDFIKLRSVNIDQYIDTLVNKTKYSKKTIYEMLFHSSFDDKDDSTRPLSKLNRDLAMLLKLI